MSGFGNVMKNGWHPKGKDGGKESWRGDFKGINQVAGWMGKGKEAEQQRSEHVSRPLATLKDPSSFGPPPKNVNYHGGAAVPDRITPDRRGLGTPLAQPPTPVTQQTQEEQRPSRPAPPPTPYRADTTGLQTNNLPPPPIHRAVAEQMTQVAPQSVKPKPSLPPRLPSRTQSSTSAVDHDPPPAYEPTKSPSPVSLPPSVTTPSSSTPQLNQSALNRLGNAGVSVPGFGIGRQQSSPSTTSNGSQLSELQSRFAKMNTKSPPQSETTQSSQPPSQGTTWAQKQQAAQTAQAFHRDPTSVNAQDARQAASTINNFRERHNDQIQAGALRANELNKKHNITGRINNFLERQASTEQMPQQQQAGSPGTMAAIERKPPPPPPPKKPANMASQASNGAASSPVAPPPVPLGTKPR